MRNIVNIAIVDDLSDDRSKLQNYLIDYAARHCLNWQIKLFSSGEAFLNSLSAISFAIVFLDIVMDGINGMETAREMRKRCPEILLVFVTTEEDYALEGYEVEAAGFLIKNNSDQSTRLDKLMQRLTSRLHPDNILEVSENNVSLQIPASRILYIEMLNHDMLLHTQEGNHLVRMTMSDIKDMLPKDGRFFECHRGIIINLDTVSTLDSQVIIMENGDTLPVSRRKKTELDQAYAARSIARVRRMI